MGYLMSPRKLEKTFAPLLKGEVHFSLFPKVIERQEKYREVSQKPKSSARDEPVEDNIVRAIEPLFLRIHLGVVLLIDPVVKPPLPPPKNRPLFKSLPRHS